MGEAIKEKNIFTDVKDDSKSYTKKEISEGKLMAIVAYIIALVPYFVEKKNKYVRYHAVQGMNLLIVWVAYILLYTILTSIIRVPYATVLGTFYVTPSWLTGILGLIGVGKSILCILGIVYVVQGKAKELPIINKIKIIK